MRLKLRRGEGRALGGLRVLLRGSQGRVCQGLRLRVRPRPGTGAAIQGRHLNSRLERMHSPSVPSTQFRIPKGLGLVLLELGALNVFN